MTIPLVGYCYQCANTVNIYPVGPEEEFWRAVEADQDVEVTHPADGGDHRWKLNHAEKENLRTQRRLLNP
jgi:hypothetical protein